MLRPKIFLTFIVIAIITASTLVYVVMIQDECRYQKQFETPGIHACISTYAYERILGHHSYYLKLVNNTPDSVLPAKEVTADQWQLFRKTDTGWQKFDSYLSGTPFEIPDIDKGLLSQQTQEYDIDVSLGRHGHDPVISPETGVQVSFENTPFGLYSGDYIIQIEYIKQQSLREEILVIYTNSFAYRQSSLAPVLIRVQPTLSKQDNLNVVNFVISNESKQDVWLRPIGLTIQGVDGLMKAEYFDITVMRQVDETSWKYIDHTWPILKSSNQPIKIEAGETRHLQGVDLGTEFVIDQPGIYSWIMPIYLEYFPDAKEPRLNRRRYLFSEEIEVK